MSLRGKTVTPLEDIPAKRKGAYIPGDGSFALLKGKEYKVHSEEGKLLTLSWLEKLGQPLYALNVPRKSIEEVDNPIPDPIKKPKRKWGGKRCHRDTIRDEDILEAYEHIPTCKSDLTCDVLLVDYDSKKGWAAWYCYACERKLESSWSSEQA